MTSIREFVSKQLISNITDDVRDFRIFNEADLQYRAAYHLDRGYVSKSRDFYLLNQPYVRIGRGRGAAGAKPDIVIADLNDEPFSAFELKCYLEGADEKVSTISAQVWADIDQLRKFQQRYPRSEMAFAIVLVDIPEILAYETLVKDFNRNRESWMTHYLQVHVINIYCDENLRKRTRYEQWADQWLARRL